MGLLSGRFCNLLTLPQGRVLAGMVALAAVLPGLSAAQQATPAEAPPPATVVAPVLTLDQDRMFRESAYGKSVLDRAEKDSAALAAENRRIEAGLETEERALTARRATMTPAEFAPIADEFDTRVEAIRSAQAAKSHEITDRLEQERKTFLAATGPILGELMQESGAALILNKEAYIISLSSIDITDRVIERLDQRLPPPDVSPAQDTPEAAPATP
ncbi:OmpH family outer membrane protein [Pseudogemmobacter blasticus]|uniref:Periplasmic chaperone for outer membrane proteins Skp n=1 Tax=Fuscovulum blasticum DSM 2131 TaxID=1188250 RepID=A0A2T4J7H5_FUSBL|nr:OmpH family outer membrane protein [Fuscovulum blasticum]PTE13850.1 hypothetical protein C5F44_12445 [Fuscovulum blasticum DSM 2131]